MARSVSLVTVTAQPTSDSACGNFLTFLRTKCAWPERREVRNGRFFGGSGWYKGIRNLYLDPAFAVPLFVAGDSHPPRRGLRGAGLRPGYRPFSCCCIDRSGGRSLGYGGAHLSIMRTNRHICMHDAWKTAVKICFCQVHMCGHPKNVTGERSGF